MSDVAHPIVGMYGEEETGKRQDELYKGAHVHFRQLSCDRSGKKTWVYPKKGYQPRAETDGTQALQPRHALCIYM